MDTRAPADLRVIYAPIEKELAFLGQFLEEEFSSGEPFIGRILEHVSQFRGKQIRPALLFLASRLAGAEPTREHVKIAAVVELIHTATLVHDDILDAARLRRNVETVHRRWGERAGVLIGDFIYSRAFNISTEVKGMARVLSDTTHTVCEGELLQLENRFRPDMGEQTYLEIIRKKTAILHAVSCQLGGVLGGLDPEQCQRLHGFGLDLGMAFQIVDDCLDYTGSEAETGKSLGTDLRQGKMTLPLIYLMECLSRDEVDWLNGLLKHSLEPQAEERIHELVSQHGVMQEAISRADAYVQSAKATLAETTNGSAAPRSARESLELMADFIVRRQR